MRFLDKYIKGLVIEDDIDRDIDIWHKSTKKIELHEFLGMTETEYDLFVDNPSKLPEIALNRK